MTDIEIPIGKRTKQYRFFEILPAALSYGAIILLFVLAFINAFAAAIYLLIIIISMFIKSVGIAARTLQGYSNLKNAALVDWQGRLNDLSHVYTNSSLPGHLHSGAWKKGLHTQNMQAMIAQPELYPNPSAIYNAIIIALYNETEDVLLPTMESVKELDFPSERTIIFIAYEERGGKAPEELVHRMQKKYASTFFDFILVKHPKDLPGEVVGKGGNITYAGRVLQDFIKEKSIDPANVIVTTLDSDNRPHKQYLSNVTYEFITHRNRQQLSYQPVSLFMNNIWDVPAPMRVIATGNSFWNIISSMRPHMLRNFASHSQGLQALEGMNFWSVRTIVEDGHQFWRSFFYFDGKYAVVPIFIPIYQDAVLASTYRKTLKAQFIQLRRWAYGASDVPYVAERVFTKHRTMPFFTGFAYFMRLLDSHVTLSCVPLIIAFGGWVPLFFNQDAARSIVAHELPEVISIIQRVAMIGIFITVFLTFKLLPPRPARYKKHRNIFMLLQWLLMPITAICYSAAAGFNAQTHLALGKYLDKFDATEKSVRKA